MGISLRITLAEAAAGCTKTIAYDRLAPCDDCGGTGVAEGGHEKTCTRCHGTGRVVEVQRTIFGQMQSQSTCPTCHGSGRVVDNPCETCAGEGRTPSHETVKVDIPAGIHTGQSIRVEGRGEAGVRGDVSGDLVVTIQILEDERFERQGDDVYVVAKVDAIDAMLGTRIKLDGILADEHLEVDIPSGCQYGQRIPLDGKGMPRLGSIARGTLVVAVQVTTPDNLTAEQVEMLQQIQWQRSQQADSASDDEQGEQTSQSDTQTRTKPKSKRPRKNPFRGKRR
jgi:molecular chaperone DnaJ